MLWEKLRSVQRRTGGYIPHHIRTAKNEKCASLNWASLNWAGHFEFYRTKLLAGLSGLLPEEAVPAVTRRGRDQKMVL